MNIKNNRVSVIVPVYQVEPYLRRCLDSIINQTYPHLEIILVDDGSPDRCGEICDEYASRDSRIRVIHQENRGVSAARNAGLDIATGDYIGFVDSDDYIALEMYERLLLALMSNSAEIAICNFCLVDGTDRHVILPVTEGLSHEEQLRKVILNQYTSSACVRLYIKSLFDNLRFPVGRRYEDYIVAPVLHQSARKIVAVNDVLYYYDRANPNSIMHITERNLTFQFEELVVWVERIIEFDRGDTEFYFSCIHEAILRAFYLLRWNAKLSFLNDAQADFIKSFIGKYNYRKLKKFNWLLCKYFPVLFNYYSIHRLKHNKAF